MLPSMWSVAQLGVQSHGVGAQGDFPSLVVVVHGLLVRRWVHELAPDHGIRGDALPYAAQRWEVK